ncbi:MAG TPA: undecaprenyldiphospho-muramoylpentapeptide beta-N-acetylglucosaminyltransferase [Bacteroidia bacterium]|nr:undecaprenyldiphospho-muramoylpentapeptide beta-N-acetylglucosaminyltransferase [Bacteroidia bacterium]
MRPLKIVISGGGTGGHIFPAIAIAKALQKKNPDTEILFVGAKGRMEMEKVPAAGYKIIGLTIAGIQRKLDLRNFLLPFKLVKSLIEAHKLLKEFKPDIAIGVGGYASAPTLYMASQMDVPTLIQEQNSYAGLTNKLLAKRASAICVAFPHMEKYFPANKIVLTGNPVREDLQDISGKRDEALKFFGLDGNRKTLLVIGGSLGARTINNAMLEGLHLIEEQDTQVLWQTGKFFYTKAKEKNSGTIKVFDFINRMDLAYAAADVVISRAGALSIAELCLTAKPCILVPSPNVAEDHQTKNAMALVNEGAAQLVKDSEAGKVLVNKALYLLHNDNQQAELKEKISALAMRNAADKIVDEVYKVVGE